MSEATFTSNTASATFPYYGEGGGGIDATGGTVIVTNTDFVDNSAPSGGGGGIGYSYGTLTVSGSTFTGNMASGGGAIQESFATLLVSSSDFTSNVGVIFGGAIDNGTSFGTVTDCTFTGNSAPFSARSTISMPCRAGAAWTSRGAHSPTTRRPTATAGRSRTTWVPTAAV